MRKIYMFLLLLVLIFGMSCVSSADLVSHDFNYFTMDVPSDASFKNGESYYMPLDNFDASSDLQSQLSSPENTHPFWIDQSIDLKIEYVDFTEDAFDDYKDVMANGDDFSGSTFKQDDGDLHIYDISNSSEYDLDYAVCKLSDDKKSVVIVCGDDLNQLKEMANSVKFD